VDKFTRKGNSSLIIVILSAFLIIGVALYLALSTNVKPQPIGSNPTDLQSYTSQDLGITFDYPKEWFVNEKGFDILITSYPTFFGENKITTNEQIELFIGFFSNCFPDYEQDLLYPGCGEGGEESKNTIVSKEGRSVQGGTFYKYVVKTPRNEEFIYYILYKDDKNILRINKKPDPSQFEKEFEEIVNSIKFTD